jgi:hypothetical protein
MIGFAFHVLSAFAALVAWAVTVCGPLEAPELTPMTGPRCCQDLRMNC